MAQGYARHKNDPLTEKEMQEKYKDIQEEMKEVLEWKKEEEAKLKNPKASIRQKITSEKALKKVARRVNTVKGQIIYWKMRLAGESHFKSSLEMNEYWASCDEK